MSIQRTYTGRGGQMAFVAELLFRGCNGAVPEVDQGLDVFAFRDESDQVARIQIKTGHAEKYKTSDGYRVQFSVPLKQLDRDDVPALFYAFVVRLDEQVVDYLIIPRFRLRDFWKSALQVGTEAEGNLVLTVQFREQVICGEVDLTEFRRAWHLLPPLQLPESEAS
jgi:hypothetical protein